MFANDNFEWGLTVFSWNHSWSRLHFYAISKTVVGLAYNFSPTAVAVKRISPFHGLLDQGRVAIG